MYKLSFYVPESHLEVVKQALFKIGVGKIGNYSDCCWQVLGQGQFRPLQGSNPYVGEQSRLEVVDEYKVEMVFDDALLTSVVTTLKQAHPYEEPAYDIWPLLDVD